MSKLELKIPPVALLLVSATCMAGIAQITTSLAFNGVARTLIALLLVVGGLWIALLGVLTFKKAKTTVNPITPQAASTLVTAGVYAYTRNPMYLGFLLILGAWAVVLSNPYAAVILPVFVLYMNRFQIEAEERILLGLFGQAFSDYQARVRRWL